MRVYLTVAILLVFSIGTLKAQEQQYAMKWDDSTTEAFDGYFEEFLSGVHNDFINLKGDLIDSSGGDKVYESTVQIGQFETQIEHSKDGTWLVSADYDYTGDYYDMNKFKELLTGVMDKVSDSADNPDYKLTKGMVRKIIGNGSGSYIVIAQYKKPQSYFIMIGKLTD